MTPVEAHSGRWALAPAPASAVQRSDSWTSSKAAYAAMALATAALPSSAVASGVPIASSRLSISVSTRETKNDATLRIVDRSLPAALACSRPVR